jgi:hypothetical protein
MCFSLEYHRLEITKAESVHINPGDISLWKLNLLASTNQLHYMARGTNFHVYNTDFVHIDTLYTVHHFNSEWNY